MLYRCYDANLIDILVKIDSMESRYYHVSINCLILMMLFVLSIIEFIFLMLGWCAVWVGCVFYERASQGRRGANLGLRNRL